MKTLKDVVKEHNPEKVNDKLEGGVYGCPEDYLYLTGHYASDECMTGGNGNCNKCWAHPYLTQDGEKEGKEEKNDRVKIIEGAKIMRNICKENIRKETVNDCKKCSIYDICFEFDYASLDGSFTPECIGELPEK